MRGMRQRFSTVVTFMTLLASAVVVFGTVAAVQADSAALLVSAALLLGAVAVQFVLVTGVAGDSPGVGRRARAHRQAVDAMPAPQHPDTAGRPRTRAPARFLAAA